MALGLFFLIFTPSIGAQQVTELNKWKPIPDLLMKYDIEDTLQVMGLTFTDGLQTLTKIGGLGSSQVQVELVCARDDKSTDPSSSRVIVHLMLVGSTFDLPATFDEIVDGRKTSQRNLPHLKGFTETGDFVSDIGSEDPSVAQFVTAASLLASSKRYYSMAFSADYAKIELRLDAKNPVLSGFIQGCSRLSPKQERLAKREAAGR